MKRTWLEQKQIWIECRNENKFELNVGTKTKAPKVVKHWIQNSHEEQLTKLTKMSFRHHRQSHSSLCRAPTPLAPPLVRGRQCHWNLLLISFVSHFVFLLTFFVWLERHVLLTSHCSSSQWTLGHFNELPCNVKLANPCHGIDEEVYEMWIGKGFCVVEGEDYLWVVC